MSNIQLVLLFTNALTSVFAGADVKILELENCATNDERSVVYENCSVSSTALNVTINFK